ncbi:peptide-methionine (S)-S-oxide reductase MsrA [Pantoea sp. 1.19]|uniref:peptide-methionine (S)-S-oxide reductase MsrA n=1 Tax=Pantoea sp. 1.19 TaxID=1925589 RepID=UPI000B305B04|nr:peptide-methionine (S)-S-oxide reductase MsrA [Pantoea sp. 1.19]
MVAKLEKSLVVKWDRELPGRETPLPLTDHHAVNGHSLTAVPEGMQVALFGMGCFWGVERLFWQQPGVWSTAAGYSGGYTPHPTYDEVCSGRTGHAEVVRVVFDPTTVRYEQLLTLFWENHNPSQGLRQGNDIGSQYRSALYWLDDAQANAANASLHRFENALIAAGRPGEITTEVCEAGPFYFAEDYHQQYLYKNPHGYCGLGGIGVCLPPDA